VKVLEGVGNQSYDALLYHVEVLRYCVNLLMCLRVNIQHQSPQKTPICHYLVLITKSLQDEHPHQQHPQLMHRNVCNLCLCCHASSCSYRFLHVETCGGKLRLLRHVLLMC